MCGDAENVDISSEVLNKIITPLIYVHAVCLSGGEPSLNAQGIEDIVNLMISRKATPEKFVLVTNGKEYSEQMAEALIKLENAIKARGNKEVGYSHLSISRDIFHEPQAKEAYQRYSELGFFVDSERKRTSISKSGNAIKNNVWTAERREAGICFEDTEKNYIGIDNLFIDAYGNVLSEDTISYDEHKKYTIGNILTESLFDILQRESDRRKASRMAAISDKQTEINQGLSAR
jgi:organic radical activating enzyme